MKKFRIVVLAFVIAMICILSIFLLEIWRIRAKLNDLYEIAENTHSGMVDVAIKGLESLLGQRIMQMGLVMGSLAIGLVLLYVFKLRRAIGCSVAFLMLVTSLIPTVNAESGTRYYARVEMQVPTTIHVTYVGGYFTPRPVALIEGFVCYHIGVISTQDPDWIGAGYIMDQYGSTFYVETLVDGVYEEIRASGLHFNQQYCVDIIEHGPKGGIGEGRFWDAYIYDFEWNVLISKTGVCFQPDTPPYYDWIEKAVAGGESNTQNGCMKAEFSELIWYAEGQHHWDGTILPCTTLHDSPYMINITVPYYEFTLSGGTEAQREREPEGGGSRNYYYCTY